MEYTYKAIQLKQALDALRPFFQTTRYVIVDSNDCVLLQKFYAEPITQLEQEKIFDTIFNAHLAFIQQKIAESKRG